VEREPQTTRERAMLLLRATLFPGRLPTSEGQRLVWVIRIAIVLGGLLLISSAVDKPLWSWLQLLIVPAALAIGVAWLNWAQRQREREAEDAQQQREHEAEEARRERERKAQEAQRESELEVENQRAQDAALQAYLDQVSQLLLNSDPPLRESKDAQALARARTLTVLKQLDPERKESVLLFLIESKLIKSPLPTIDLARADFSGISSKELLLSQPIHLHGVNLQGADLSGALMNGTNLVGANLEKADLGSVWLNEANLTTAYLPKAKLRSAHLQRAKLEQADLRSADLVNASLQGADLSNASLDGAELFLANLTGATVTDEQLATCKSLIYATMPNGKKYEDWLKSKDRGEGMENSGPS
jgi:uncharacterized protein YjbI with pentapeptide repeats